MLSRCALSEQGYASSGVLRFGIVVWLLPQPMWGSHLLLLIHTAGRSCARARGFCMLPVCAAGHFSCGHVSGMFVLSVCFNSWPRLLMYGVVVVPAVFPLALLLALLTSACESYVSM